MMYILIGIIVILILIIILQNVKINSITNNIEKVAMGNFNERIRIGSSNSSVKKLIINLNKLIDEIQKIVSLNKQYEEDRKKMISNISHDFRTPLTAMLGYIEMLKNDDGLTDNERKEYLDIIDTKGEILRNLIEEFFYLSKFDSEDIMINPKKVNITEIIRRSILSFLKDFETNDIEPVIDIEEKDIFLKVDEKAIERILQNLISNALKYGKEGKTIGVRLKENTKNVVIEVWGKGTGIPKEDLSNIFKRMYSVDRSRNSKLKGSGLGLTIVKKMVEKHGGTIEVKSKPYEKTVFTITLKKY